MKNKREELGREHYGEYDDVQTDLAHHLATEVEENWKESRLEIIIIEC